MFKTAPRNKIGKSVFNLSYEKKLMCDMGQLIPILHDEMVPSDVFNIGNQLTIRMQPIVAPIMHEINAYIHYFFVPYRILWDDWEDLITGGVDGSEAPTLPKWTASDYSVGSLWDFFGFPTLVVNGVGRPTDFMRRAYNMIYNEYYRDQNLVSEIDITTAEDVQLRSWEKDYFTSALPWQQRIASPPAFPITGIIDVDGKDAHILIKNTADSATRQMYFKATSGNIEGASVPSSDGYMRWVNPQLEVDLEDSVSFNVADLRLTIATQRWLEVNARAGARLEEFTDGHFNIKPGDARVQRPEYIGGSKTPILISEVLQTSEDGSTPQGNLAGHGISVDSRKIGTYRAREYGIIMGILSIMPRAAYSQGINRQWLTDTKFDYYFPEFANLSEQGIWQAELVALNVGASNKDIFGYQGRWDHMRHKQNLVVGDLRSTYDYWHLARQFSGAQTLNQTFLECDGTSAELKRIFAAPSEPGFIVSVGNIIRAVRPLPITSNPSIL